MNPLKEDAHLFANGKFKLLVEGVEKDFKLIEEFVGLCGKETLITDFEENTPINHCTLIARPIADMTDEELATMIGKETVPDDYSEGTLEAWRAAITKELNSGEIYRNDFLHLLSIGVYPFDQSHFQDGTVIDSREV